MSLLQRFKANFSKSSTIVFFCLMLSSTVIAAEFTDRNQTSPREFANNDTVIFIGDSITHGGSYHIDLALFYATRFPERNIEYINAGISGDTAVGTLKRFDQDIAIHQPTIATIMLGMNDVRRELYGLQALQNQSPALFVAEQTKTRALYLQAMQSLIEQLMANNTEVVVLTPSIFDQTAVLPESQHAKDPQAGINDELANYGRLVGEFAKQNSQQVIDFQAPMLAINQLLQAQDKSATIVSPDRIHPYDMGHFVMTYTILKSQFTHHKIGEIAIDAINGEQASTNCKAASKIELEQSGLSFTCVNSALPFPLSDPQKNALAYVPFNQEFNQYAFKVKGLQSSHYELLINEQSVGKFTQEALSEGINIASVSNSPLYQQALEVKKYNDARALNAKLLRDLKQIEYSMLSNYPELDRSDTQALSQALYRLIESSKGKPWYGWLEGMVANYLKNKDKHSEYEQKQIENAKKMYEVNQPRPYTFTLKAVSATNAAGASY